MSLIVEKKQGNYAPKSDMPQGLHLVKVTKVEDLGMVPVSPLILAKNQAQARKEGRDPSTVATSVHQARVFFQNAAKQTITRDYTMSLHEKAALYAAILAITGKAPSDSFDVESLVGKKAQAMVVQKISGKGNAYTAINTLVPAGAATQAPAPCNPRAADDDGTGITDADVAF